jgi:hypothetical protein
MKFFERRLQGIYYLCFVFIFSISAKADNITTHIDLKWQAPYQTVLIDYVTKITVLNFTDTHYDFARTKLPFYYNQFKLGSGTAYNIDGTSIENALYVPLEKSEQAIFDNSLQQSVQKTYDGIHTDIVTTKKQAYAAVRLFPFRKNTATGQMEKLISFDLKLNYSAAPSFSARATAAPTYNSVLAEGNWYKISLREEGVYKLSYTFLKNLGIDVKTVKPQNIQLFGNGGGQLPYLNSAERKDDLQENRIYVEDAGTIGVFDSTDYVLFYGQSQHRWSYNKNAGCAVPFVHHVNEYADTTYYFLSVDRDAGKRIAKQADYLSTPANQQVTLFDDYAFHENDAVNLAKTGSLWLGEKLDATNPTFKFTPANLANVDPSSPVVVRARIVGNDPMGCYFDVSLGNISKTVKTDYFSSGGDNPPFGGIGYECFSYNGISNVALAVTKSSSGYTGWIDYVEVLARRQLAMSGAQLTFRDSKSVGTGNVGHFTLATSANDVIIWDITDPCNVYAQEVQKNASKLDFNIQTDSLHQFIAFTGANYLVPSAVGAVPNQNLHAITKKEYIIVTHPLFWNEAVALAKMHNDNDGLSAAVVTIDQIYNEFSSGAPDASAIRDFMRVLYKRATTPAELPKYLLLIGDGSYDNKNRLKNNTAFLPSYQTPSSLDPSGSFVSDDFFVQLDDDEGAFDEISTDLPDVAVGRLPVKTIGESQAVLSKIMRYVEKPGVINMNGSGACTTGGTCTAFGDWRNTIGLISDDGEGGEFVYDCEAVSSIINKKTNEYTLDKIYFDAFPRVATPGGNRFPDVVDAVNKRVEKGALFLAYVGHGGEAGLAHERVVSINQINNWKNPCSQPFWFTATCEFGRWDNPEMTTGGECVLLNPSGGGIGLFTTVRLIYIYANTQIVQNFFKKAFDTTATGEPQRIGDISLTTKFTMGPGSEFRGFSLLCDPALTIAYPKHHVITTAINNKVVAPGVVDSVSALSQVTIKGEVQDKNGNKLTGFNGLIFPTVYDKMATLTTLSNDQDSPPVSFQLQKNILYKGKASVTNGDFSFTFVVPKDISFQQGKAKISYYGYNGSEDAGGAYDNLIISGINPNPVVDKQGPAVKLFLNDDKFVMGGITDDSPKIYAVVSDSNGINAGNGIGHDLTAVIDGKTESPVTLNDYYETEVNSYKKGFVRYPLSKLEAGKHTINMKVWDVYNNSSNSYTEFVVTSNAKLALEHVLNYPNPFTTKTSFYFEHNNPCDRLSIQIQIFTVSGKLVKSINMITQCDGYKTAPIDWDGLDDYGDRIAKGVYIYRLKVTTPKGEAAEKFEKLVVIK